MSKIPDGPTPLRPIQGGKTTTHNKSLELGDEEIELLLVPHGEWGMILLEKNSLVQVFLDHPVSFQVESKALQGEGPR